MMQNISVSMSPRSPSGFTDIKKPNVLHHPVQAKNLHFNPYIKTENTVQSIYNTPRPDSSVGSVFSSDKLDTSARQVQILLVSLAIILISEKLSNCSCSGMYVNGLTVTFRVAVVSQCMHWLSSTTRQRGS